MWLAERLWFSLSGLDATEIQEEKLMGRHKYSNDTFPLSNSTSFGLSIRYCLLLIAIHVAPGVADQYIDAREPMLAHRPYLQAYYVSK